MAFTHQDIEQLRSQTGDWQKVWSRLWGELDLRLHGIIFFGPANDPSSWQLNRQFKLLRDESTAQDFISDLLLDFSRRAEQGTLLASFEGTPEQLLPFLAAPEFVGHRAKDHLARARQHGIINLPGDHDRAPAIHRIDGDELNVAGGSDSVSDADPLRAPLRLEFRPGASIGATIRMAAVQCWPRFPSDQAGLEQLESDLRERLAFANGGDPIVTLEAVHVTSRRRLTDQLLEIEDQIINTPGMQDPRRDALDTQRLKIQIDLLLVPLDRKALQSMMGQSDEAIFKQVSRYKREFRELFPDLEERLDAVVRRGR